MNLKQWANWNITSLATTMAYIRQIDQRGYHESTPFSRWNRFRTHAMKLIAMSGGMIKYGHSEVGNFTKGGKVYEQNEIEFLPTNVEDAADQLVKAKWIVRTLAEKYGVTVTFAPKITVGKAGSGLHIHTRVMKNGKNMMIKNGKLSDVAKTAIAGYMNLAPSLTAFGNQNPTSLFQAGTTPGSPNQHLLGRSQPFSIGQSAIGLDYTGEHDSQSESAGKW